MEEREFKRLYDRYAVPLFNFILWTTGNRTVSEDILQTVFAKIWQSGVVPADGDDRRRWLFTVARNACMDYFRSVKRQRIDEDPNRYTVQSDDRNDDGKLAWEQVRQLHETDRIIIFLHLKIGYDYDEIGDLLGMTGNHVRVRMCRALRKLREILVRKGV